MALTLTAAENLAEFDAVYLNSDGEAALVDANAAATVPALFLAKAAILEDASGEFYQIGDEITNVAWSWTPGGYIFASTTPGGLTQTAPSGSGDQVQIVGLATAATKMLLYPQLPMVEIA